LSQENNTAQETIAVAINAEDKQDKEQRSIQKLAEALKSMADDVGQISELAAEEKLLVAEFFKSLFKLMQPLTPAMLVSTSALPVELGKVMQAHIDPTGHLALVYEDEHLELKDLKEESNRDLMILVVRDVIPKFRNLTSMQKRKIENRIKFLSAVTKEMQKISGIFSATVSGDQE
jgi:ferric iron reductase protein FhuF